MADVFSKAKRSQIMSRVRGRGNEATELRFVRLLRATGITGWRRGYSLTGKPDITFPKEKVSIFLDGCFWHGCPIHGTCPSTNSRFWRGKLKRNKQRDEDVNRILRSKGWRVLRIWQHELKNPGKALIRIHRALNSEKTSRPRM